MEPTLPPLIEHFLDAAALPGLLASSLRAARIRGDENGQPRYQLRVDVRNDEPAAGVAALSWRTETEGASQWHVGTHAVVPGRTSIEIGATSPLPPLEARLETYLSRNRRALALPLPHFDHTAAVDWPPLDGARPSSWMPREDGIVVDDLDPGFSVTRADAGGFGWSSQSPESAPNALRGDWWRQEDPNTVAWGKYRRTLVRKPRGEGAALARFDVALPEDGRWRRAYHLPGDAVRHVRYGRLRRHSLGTLDIRLVVDGVETALPFDSGDADIGWNDLGVFDLPAGRVQIAVSDRTSGDVVVADAVRWQWLSA